jgi:diguanylate cyclase (GGDEF)-like protein/PAS domain S-box-containing protein
MAFVCAISLLAIIGWLFNQPVLASLRPEFIPMAPSTALIFLGLCSAWVIFRVYSARRGMRILVQASLAGILIIVIILALRYFTGLGPDLEQMLVPNPTLFGQIETARISPLTALGFFLTIPVFLLMALRAPGKRIKSAAAVLCLVVLILSSLNILGYIYGAPPFYGGTLIPVAVTTALSFFFLSLALLMAAGPACWPVRMFVGSTLRARLMRTFMPASLLIVLLQGLFSTASAPWIINPALRVAVAALVAGLIVTLIISLIANNLSKEIERTDQARIRAESALNQSEERFRTLAESANDAIINIDQNGHIVFWNRASETIFGYSAEEVTGKPVDMIMPDEFHTAYQQGLQSVVLTGETHIIGKTVEMTGQRKNGSKFPLSLSLATWQVGGMVFFTCIAREISEVKQAEEAFLKSESSLKAVLQSTADGILAIGIENEVLYANERFAELWRIPQAVMDSKDDSILLHTILDQLNDPQGFLKYVQELYKSKGESFDTLNFKDGRVFERLSRPLMQGEEIRGRVWSFRDVTESKALEEKLGKERILLRTLIDNIPDRIYVMDAQGRKVISNQADWQASGGKTEDDVIGKTDLDTYPLELAKKFWADNMDVIDSGISILNREEPGLDFQGNPVYILSSKVPLHDSQGNIAGLVGVGRDITERKEAEELQDAIYRIAQAADIAESLDSLYPAIHSIIQEVMVADNFYIALYDEKNDLISFPYSIDEQDLRFPPNKSGKGLTEFILRTGKTVLCDEALYEELIQRAEIELVGAHSPIWLGVPLMVESKAIGVMVVQDYKNARAYGEREKRILEFVSTQVARAIERKRLEDEIRSLSLTDELTGLYNRRGFTLLAEQEVKLAQRMNRAMLLFFGDMDNLKTINDTWGHTQGDQALNEIAAIFKQNFRESDIVARIGGDEFVVLAVDAAKETAKAIANRIQASLNVLNQRKGETYHLAISLGIARYDPEAPCTLGELISQADSLMYLQKQARKGK